MNSIVNIVGLVAFFLPTLLITFKWLKNHWWLSKIIWFMILSTIVVPLLVFYAQHFAGVLFTARNVWLLVGLIDVLAVYFYQLTPPVTTQSIKPNIPTSPSFYWFGLLVVAALSFAYPYFFHNQPLIGGDSGVYLHNSSLLLKNHLPADTYDRSIIDFLPAIVSVLTGLSVETIFKILVTGYEIMFVVISTFLASRLLHSRHSLIVGLSLIFSLAELYLAKFNIPFFMSMVILYFLIEQIMGEGSNTPKNILIPILWGALFNLHGVIALTSLLIILPITLINAPAKKWSIFSSLVWLALFIGAGQPLMFSLGSRLSAGLINPIISTFTTRSTKTPDITPTSPSQIWVDEYTTSTRTVITAFPLHQADYIGNYSALVIYLALSGIVLMSFNQVVTRRIKNSFLYVGTALFLLTQQELLGTNWFPTRFILGLAPIIMIAAIFSLETLGRLIKNESVAFYAAVAFIALPNLLTTLPKIMDLSANIETKNYQFIEQLKSVLPPNAPIFVAAADGRWIQGLIPASHVFLTSPAAICSDKSILTSVSEELWLAGQAFSHEVSLDQSIALFKTLAGKQPYYVYLDTQNYHCINGSLFPAPDYAQILRSDKLIVLRHD